MDDRHLLSLEVIGQILAGDTALHIVAAARPEYVIPAFLCRVVGQGGIGRGRRHLQNAGLVIDRRGRNRRRRTVMSSDEHYLFSYDIVCCRDRLLRIARIVGNNEIELLAEYPALGINIGDRHFGPTGHLLTESCV